MGKDARSKLLEFQAGQAAPSQLRERYGRPIIEGAMYEFHPALAPPFKVVQVTPVLDPSSGLPPGACKITLQTQVQLVVIPGQPIEILTLVQMPQVSEPQNLGNGSGNGVDESQPPIVS